MKISIELPLSPLQDNFKSNIIDFIKKPKASELTVKEKPVSIQFFVDNEEVMALLNSGIKDPFDAMDHWLIFMKILKSDRSDYATDF